MIKYLRIIGILILLVTAFAGVGYADESAPSPLVEVGETPLTEGPSLEGLMSEAMSNNPAIASALADWRAAVEIFPQAKAWPDPSLDVTWKPEFIQPNGGGRQGIEARLMQMIPNPRRTSLLGKRALTAADGARVKYEVAVRDVLTDVMNSYFELGYLNASKNIALANQALFGQLTDTARLGYSKNEIPLSELSAAEARLAQSQYEVLLTDELLASEESNMRSLLAREPGSEIGKVDLPDVIPVDLKIDDVRDRVLEFRQELKLAGISVDLARLNVSIAGSMSAPDYSLGLMYETAPMPPDAEGMSTGFDKMTGIMFGVTIPLWGGKNRARVDEAKARLDSAEANLEDMQNKAIADSDRVYWKLNNDSRLVTLYEDTLLPNASNAAMTSQTLYEQGLVSFSELLENRLVVSNFQLAAARAGADYLESLAQLQRLIGMPIVSWPDEPPETETVPAETGVEG